MSDSSGNKSYSGQEINSNASSELKLYQAFIFSVPILFTFILLLLFYLFYLRRRRVDWSSLRMRTTSSLQAEDGLSRCEIGLKKELREMLPIIVYKASFSVKDTQCSVCLVDYQANDRLQQIPACGHVFHMDCIDHWLAAHTTCPLCRQCLLASAKASSSASDIQIGNRSSNDQNGNESSIQDGSKFCEGTQSSQEQFDLGDTDKTILDSRGEDEESDSEHVNTTR